jgi:hypothetical protein
VEKKGFFKIEKRPLWMLIGLLLFSAVMYIPSFYYSYTELGTAYQFIWAAIVLMLAPVISFIDTFLS